LIDAPRERVFKAFSDPTHLTRWWGPNGFTSTFHEFDFRPGGKWRFILHGPDGKDYPNESLFTEIAVPEKVVLEHTVGHHFFLTVTFTAQGHQTLLGWRQVFDTVREKQRLEAIVSDANEQNLDRLAAEMRNVA
jgi:uncharacterized protein YndB with AHSA1/START domain